MAPHALTPPPTPALDDLFPVSSVLEEFSVTRNGFLPETLPLQSISSGYYLPWEAVIHDLPKLIANQQIRDRVDSLDILDTRYLANEPEWRRAFVVLSFLAHGYIWGGDEASQVLPPSISVPFLEVSAHLQLPPVATYAALNLWNFTSASADLCDLDSLHAIHTFTGTEDESWFYMVSIAIEAQGSAIIPTVLRALNAVKRKDFRRITHALQELTSCIIKLGILLDRMDEKCDPMVFYSRIRPFFAGSKNMASAGLPNGIFYDTGNGEGEYRQLRGGSNGQSSLIQFLDVVLGVEHNPSGNSNPDKKTQNIPDLSFHEEVRSYMPGPHSRFLERVAQMASIRRLASLPATTTDEEIFHEAFQEATRTLGEFRNKHIQLVTRYIIIPSRQLRSDADKRINLASASSKVHTKNTKTAEESLTGTGGTALLPFLKQSRDETFQAGNIELGR